MNFCASTLAYICSAIGDASNILMTYPWAFHSPPWRQDKRLMSIKSFTKKINIMRPYPCSRPRWRRTTTRPRPSLDNTPVPPHGHPPRKHPDWCNNWTPRRQAAIAIRELYVFLSYTLVLRYLKKRRVAVVLVPFMTTFIRSSCVDQQWNIVLDWCEEKQAINYVTRLLVERKTRYQVFWGEYRTWWIAGACSTFSILLC